MKRRQKLSKAIKTAPEMTPAKPPDDALDLEAIKAEERINVFRHGWVKEKEGGGFELVGTDAMHWLMRNQITFGTRHPFLGLGLLNQALGTSSAKPTTDDHNRTLAAIHEIEPKNALEGMLAVQMVGMHNLAMKLMTMAFHPNNLDRRENLNTLVEMANKCSRTFAAQIEALNRLRGKGNQKVIVEHISVNQGGQAVVGDVNVNRKPSEGGGPG